MPQSPTTNPLDDPTADPFAVAQAAAAAIARLTGVEKHDIALTLGSGWGKAADVIGETTATIAASDVPGFSKPALEGHVGTLRSVLLPSGKRALVIGARTHYYENHGVRRVVHSVRTAAATGATTMILTNGAGGIKETWAPGTPVLISDHLNLTADSPLEGATFIDLTDLYSKRLREIAKTIDPSLDEGVYTQFRGPHYETPAEVQMLSKRSLRAKQAWKYWECPSSPTSLPASRPLPSATKKSSRQARMLKCRSAASLQRL
jgi:purine-nucleoside phosphorylase